jgi:hypothetical protein
MIRRVKVRGGRGERKGRQVGQLEGFLFSAEGPVYGRMGGRFFTVISILRNIVCYGYGRIVRYRGGRVAHLFEQPTTRLWLLTTLSKIQKIDFHFFPRHPILGQITPLNTLL